MPKPIRPAPGPNVPTPVPNRNDRVNFASRGDATMTALPPAIDGVNTSIAYVADALDYVDEQIDVLETAVEQAGDARDEAVEASQAAVNAPGTSGTSSTSLVVGSGTKTFTTQQGKAWVVGQPVVISRTAAPSTVQMYGVISAYNSGTGSMSVVVPSDGVVGSGTYSDWTIALAGQRGPSEMTWTPVTGTTHTAAARQELALRNVGATTVSLNASPVDGERVTVLIENGRRDNVVNRNGKTIMGVADNMQLDDPDVPWPFVFSTPLDTWRLV